MQDSPKKKKILFLITKSNWGGAQRYVFDLATSLPEEEYEAVVALGGDGELVEKLAQANIRTIPIPGLQRDISLAKEIRASFAITKIIRQERPDVLHINSSKAGAIGTLIGRFTRAPRVLFTAHGWAFNEDRSHFQRVVLKTIHYLTVLWSHDTITVSHALKAQMDWPLIQTKMTTIHLGRATPELKSRTEARGVITTKIIDSEANLYEYINDFWIGTIAELHPIKRLNRSIDAIASLSRIHKSLRYIIIGDGELRAALQQQVKDLGIEQHVFFTSSIHEAGRLLPAFDIFTLPSKSESFGYVLLEAAIAGIPVVATRTGGIPDVVQHEVTGLLVPTDDTLALTGALQTLIKEKDTRTNYGEAARTHAEKFTIEKMVNETITLY